MTAALHAAALWSGLSILLLLALSGVVVRRRQRHMVAFGDGGHPELTVASRAFGNAVEYVPVALIGLMLIADMGRPRTGGDAFRGPDHPCAGPSVPDRAVAGSPVGHPADVADAAGHCGHTDRLFSDLTPIATLVVLRCSVASAIGGHVRNDALSFRRNPA